MTIATAPGPTVSREGYGSGLTLAVLSAASFGLSGSLARSLLEAGWSPAAAVAFRVLGAGVVLLVPCLVVLRRSGRPTGPQLGRMLVYGAVAVAGAQLCYFSAVQRLSVGVALLLEYSAPVLLIFFHWARSRRRPATSVFVGAALAVLGLVFVLDLRSATTLDPIGVVWGLGAALCLCAYFVLGEQAGPSAPVPPLVLSTVGMGVGGLLILALGALGVLPLFASTQPTELAGLRVGWAVPALLLVTVSGALAYLTGIVALRRLGSSVASFVSLTEVIFAVIFAVVLVGQHPSATQLVGGVLVLAGIGVVQRRAGTN